MHVDNNDNEAHFGFFPDYSFKGFYLINNIEYRHP